MKYLRKFNENLEEFYFPNADKAVETIDFYISQYQDDDYPIEKIPGYGVGWQQGMKDTNDKMKYFIRVFPNEIPENASMKTFIPRIECCITSKKKNIEMMRKLYKQMSNLPKTLLQDDLYCYITLNEADTIPGDEDAFINLMTFTNQEDLDRAMERSFFAKNWSDAKKRQGINGD
jgi:hypothetical protein